ncbi:hypothetical protein L596_017973 [Steinernema carpocapsae]|uniref:Uncharacterized protein n=1 Tax=Steinernema carpocapsae TaxID=34508 RepID=A0A4U5N3Z1_STECR|nr:hypothetical protein L596_017973 [Steinernema carpocapsae]
MKSRRSSRKVSKSKSRSDSSSRRWRSISSSRQATNPAEAATNPGRQRVPMLRRPGSPPRRRRKLRSLAMLHPRRPPPLGNATIGLFMEA